MDTLPFTKLAIIFKRCFGYPVIRSMVLLPLVLVATGCKIRVEVPEGGRVESESGAFSCETGQTCEIDIVDFFFNEAFVAIPNEGHFFRKWAAGDHKLCGGHVAQPCRISTSGQENNLTLQQFLDSDEVFSLKPIFSPGTCTSIMELEDHSWWVGPDYYYQYIYQQCTLPGLPAPVVHGQYRTYRSDQIQGAPLHTGHIRCAIDYDLGKPNTWDVYDGHGAQSDPIIRQTMRLDGSWRITQYTIDGFMEVPPGEFNDRLVITEETRSTPYEFDDCFPWRVDQ